MIFTMLTLKISKKVMMKKITMKKMITVTIMIIIEKNFIRFIIE